MNKIKSVKGITTGETLTIEITAEADIETNIEVEVDTMAKEDRDGILDVDLDSTIVSEKTEDPEEDDWSRGAH